MAVLGIAGYFYSHSTHIENGAPFIEPHPVYTQTVAPPLKTTPRLSKTMPLHNQNPRLARVDLKQPLSSAKSDNDESGNFQAGASEIQLEPDPPKNSSQPLPPIEYGIHLGVLSSNFSVFGDIFILPIKLTNDVTASTRISLGIVQKNNENIATMAINEIAYFNTPLPELKVYTEGGINIPFASDSKAGFEIALGLEQTVDFLKNVSGKLYIEAGLGSLSVHNSTDTGLTCSGGFKFSF